MRHIFALFTTSSITSLRIPWAFWHWTVGQSASVFDHPVQSGGTRGGLGEEARQVVKKDFYVTGASIDSFFVFAGLAVQG
jgi:hypothetical protein